jgi:hypothetical protein
METDTHSLQFNSNPTKRIIRKMGYSFDQDGIMRRYINERDNWQEHLNNSKDFIKQVVIKKSVQNIAILGSGWLLDVPYEFLSEHCHNVYFYDIRHPKPVINKLKKFANIELINMDITGGMIQYVYDLVKVKNYSFLSNIPSIKFIPEKKVDHIVSVNLLNQLDILLIEYLRKFPTIDTKSLQELRKQIQLNHLKSMEPGKASLITDYEEILYDRTGKLVKTSSLVFNEFPQTNIEEEWLWKFDTQMTFYQNRITHFKVKALQL